MLILSVILLGICIFFSAVFSSSETSLFSLSSHDILSFRRSSKQRENKVASLLSKPSDLLITILILNILVNIGIQNVSAQIFSSSSSWVFTILFPLVITLLLGEVLPKSLAFSKNKQIARLVAPFIYCVVRLMRHITRRVSAVTFSISRVMFFFLKEPTPVDRVELMHVLKTSLSKGVIRGHEIELIKGFLQLQDVNVKETMTPRDEVLFYNIDDPLKELHALFSKKRCSKVPVCRGSLDHILGLITLEEFFKNYSKIKTEQDLIPILKEPFYVPEHLSAHTLFQEPRMRGEDIALVVDEYGFVEGLVTHEDIVEVIVGNIVDARDQKSLYTQVGKSVIIASGKLEIVEFERLFHVHLEHSADTVSMGGWVADRLGRIPQNGDEFHANGILYHVLSSEPNRVRSLYIRRDEAAEKPKEDS